MAADAVSVRRAEHRRVLAKFGLLLLALGLSVIVSLYSGHGKLTGSALDARFLELRLHRTLVTFLAGAGLAVAGVLLQGLFRNPLASPSILGTTSGALLGGEVTLAALYALWGGRAPLGLPGEILTPLGCIGGAMLALLLVLTLTPLRASPIALLLTGFLLSALLLSFGSLLKSLLQENWQLIRVMNLLSEGSVSGSGPKQSSLAALLVIGSTLPAWLWSRELDTLLSGEEEATSLGVDVPRLRLWIVVWSGFLSASAVAVGANVAFVGLIVPHALRAWFGQVHRQLIPAAFFGGGIFLVACDVLCRLLPLPSEIPLGVVTGLIGAPLFMRMLAKLERGSGVVTSAEIPACALAVRDLCVARGGREVLSGFELRAQHGEVIALAGPNGAGKSTALKALAGLWSFTGSVEIEGKPLPTLGLRERARRLAYVPQQSLLSRALLVREVVRQGRYAHDPVWPSMRRASDAALERALASTDTLELAARRWDELSGGEQRRVLLARALATEARIVLLDEPTASLDLAHALRFLRLLGELAERGHCIVVVLHDLEQVRRCAQRAVLLQRGRSVAAGPTRDVITAEHVRAVYGVELQEGAALGYRLLDSA